jgi:DNA-binding transcriptional regulator YdaS (Cro superfamily)
MKNNMKLKKYFKGRPRGAKVELANQLGITKTWMSLLISGAKRPSYELSLKIQKITNREVTVKDLRPDLVDMAK